MQSKRKRILIVEDDPDMIDIYSFIFKNNVDKYEMVSERDARIAFKRLEDEDFDLVILDIIMEPMGGESFYAVMRSDGKIKNIPVIVVSVLSPEDIKHMRRRTGSIDFLRKPVTEKQLFEKIEKFIK